MMFRRYFMVGVFGFVLLLAAGAQPVAAEDPGKNAEQFISGLADQAVEALTNTDISKQDRAKRFRVMLTDNFAIKTIARWVLGRHWKKASDAEKTEYLHLFEELLVVTYVDRFSSYSGESLKIVKSLVNNPKDAVVFSEISHEGNKPIHVDWRVRTKDSVTFKIIDVLVEGVSMGQTQRSEFASVIRQHGGNVEGLLAELRKRVG
ncbi:MAG: ABC transporter substrate-binding protein [Rhodospirillaceae bacterium]|jgi:phospholipid transport system substrate-binding protein|nr:ABC transporter substrate-binding protein [Rhodospirillaceae bacterium]MBT5243233.1 ABC transporter substrate-binding protein [Rhodospirillaceae bacterium]MBT5563983.1 ABC transporter substrate-binding protein [Rhodospirillaceae bacterium]MBT6240813.1 ABC transporter substrate-binding protein [Rhodospirillaceae bacterium]MBT7136623.1 ABC transporter substrate-binding protein [Rhodospirillaceae bacterium]